MPGSGERALQIDARNQTEKRSSLPPFRKKTKSSIALTNSIKFVRKPELIKSKSKQSRDRIPSRYLPEHDMWAVRVYAASHRTRTLEPRAGSEIRIERTGQRPHPAERGEPSWPWPPSRARPTPTTVLCPRFRSHFPRPVVVAAHDSTIFTHATPRPPPLAAPPHLRQTDE